MRPVHEFIVNFDQPDGAELSSKTPVPVAALAQEHAEDSSVRNVCFEWSDGRRAFFNYAYLVAVDFIIQESINVLILNFGSYTVTLKGYRFNDLFERLKEHRPKTITAINPRYALDGQSAAPVVVEISVKSE